jgi:hypothetical protein
MRRCTYLSITTQSSTSLLVLDGTLRGHRNGILVYSSASENFCKAEWVWKHNVRLFLERNTGLNWQMAVRLRLASDCKVKCLQ